MARYVVSSLPLSTSSFAGHGRDLVSDGIDTKLDLSPGELTATTCPSKTTVDQSWTKTPLRNQEPDAGNNEPPQTGPDTSSQISGARMGEDKDEESSGDPSPAPLDKKDVEDIGLARKVTRRSTGILNMRLRDRVVWCGTRLRRDDGEDGAKDQKRWEQDKSSSLQRCRQER
ncbi:hypothetical protein HG530_003699 [Fusarium avenaceum]|nr:hypothetical protein HG530_003699 [Fusarium avenaceum]